MITPYELFKDSAVNDVRTVAEFLDRYYKPDRYKGRGADYAAVLLKSHEEGFDEDGVDIISHHDSVTGEVVAFYGKSTVMTKYDTAEERFRMSRLDIDAIQHTVFESPEYARQLIEEAYLEFERASIELHDLWEMEV